MKTILPSFLKEVGVLDKVWEDIFSPSAKKIGKALGAVTGILLASLRKYEFYAEIENSYYEYNLKKFSAELEKYDEGKIIAAPPEIVKPILDRCEYLQSNELRDAFIVLLTKASLRDTVEVAHPGYIHILDRLSVDEAKIMMHLHEKGGFTYLHVTASPMLNSLKIITMERALTSLEIAVDLLFPENIRLYMHNMISLGIIEYENPNSLNSINADSLKELYRDEIQSFILSASTDLKVNFDVQNPQITIQGHFIALTPLGRKFVDACVN